MLKGRITVHRYESKILKSNPLRDPHIRDLIIYLPPEYTESSSHGYIAVFGLVGFGGQGKMLLNADPLGENIEDRMNRLISEKKCGPMILVLLDCFTRFGGNQYINSSATGRYEDYIIKEIVPFVDKKSFLIDSRLLLSRNSTTQNGLDYLLGHIAPPIWPKTISTHATQGKQVLVYSNDEALAWFRRATLLDCRFNAYPSYTRWKGLNPT
jgi:hypothetical protein